MNPNPYKTTTATSASVQTLRSVRGLLACSAFLAIAAYPAVSFAWRLLSQEFGLFSVPYGVYEIEINGVAVSNRTFAFSALLAGWVLLSIAVTLALWARRNYKYNAAIRSADRIDDVR